MDISIVIAFIHDGVHNVTTKWKSVCVRVHVRSRMVCDLLVLRKCDALLLSPLVLVLFLVAAFVVCWFLYSSAVLLLRNAALLPVRHSLNVIVSFQFSRRKIKLKTNKILNRR